MQKLPHKCRTALEFASVRPEGVVQGRVCARCVLNLNFVRPRQAGAAVAVALIMADNSWCVAFGQDTLHLRAIRPKARHKAQAVHAACGMRHVACGRRKFFTRSSHKLSCTVWKMLCILYTHNSIPLRSRLLKRRKSFYELWAWPGHKRNTTPPPSPPAASPKA